MPASHRDAEKDYAPPGAVPADGPDYEAVRRYVEANLEQTRRSQRRALWRIHLLLYLIVNLIGWIILGSSHNLPSGVLVFSILTTIGWMVGLFLHAHALYLESTAGVRSVQARLAMQAMQTQAMRETPKLKREQILRLSDDGELVSDGQCDVELTHRARSES
jgi:hypothetical protein